MSDSPYDEHADERRPCPECGGTKTITVGDGPGEPGCHLEGCPLCGPPTQPDPAAAIKAHLDTAAHLRKLLRMAGRGYLASCLRVDIAYHEARADQIRSRAAQITGAKEVA